MSIIKYENEDLNISIESYIDNKQNVYFKGKDICNALGYEKSRNAIEQHVSYKYRKRLDEIKGALKQGGYKNIQPNTIFVSESGMYELIFSSRLPTAKKFREWVMEEVLPSIRKQGYYKVFNNPNNLTFKIENEYDLHTKVVSFIRKFYKNAIITAGLGELQDTSYKRISSYKKGYTKGQPDIIIQNLNKYYSGMCIEFKTPLNTGIISNEQKELLQTYEYNGYKCIISNDYDLIIRDIITYMHNVRVSCKYCKRKFINKNTLRNHIKCFHKII